MIQHCVHCFSRRFFRFAIYFPVYLALATLLSSCANVGRTTNLPQKSAAQQRLFSAGLVQRFGDDQALLSLAHQVEDFYYSDASTVIQPYIDAIRQFDTIPAEEFCQPHNQLTLNQAVSLNSTSLLATYQLYKCAVIAKDKPLAMRYYHHTEQLIQVLWDESKGHDIDMAMEVREIDEAYVLAELVGLDVLDVEIVDDVDGFAYKFHLLDIKKRQFQHRYFKNHRLLKMMLTDLSGLDLDNKQVTSLLLDAYTKQKYPTALILKARKLLDKALYVKAIKLLTPIAKDSALAATLLAEGFIKLGQRESLDPLLSRIDIAARNGLIEAKLLLGQYIMLFATNDKKLADSDQLLDEVDELTFAGNGVRLQVEKLSRYPDNMSLLTKWYQRTNKVEILDAMIEVAQSLHAFSVKNALAKNSVTKKANVEYALRQLAAGFGHPGALDSAAQMIERKELSPEQAGEVLYNLALIFDFAGQGVTADLAIALKYYQQAVALGNAQAQANLGYLFEAGKHVSKDMVKAHQFYQQAADQHNAQGMNNLATFYLEGNVVDQDHAKALALYQAAADMGNDFAINNMGKLYYYGWGVDKDLPLAFDYFQRAAALGFEDAIEWVGTMYHLGEGVAKDDLQAIEFLTKTSKTGYPISSFYLAEIYFVQDNMALAIAAYTLAWQQGDTDASLTLGDIYANGRKVKKDPKLAMHWFEQALAMNNMIAADLLGDMYLNGDGAARDESKALGLYQQFSDYEGFNINAYIGDKFYFANEKIQDYGRAKHFYELAATQNEENSINNLAEMYRYGQGVAVDFARAIELYHRADILKSEIAPFNLGQMYRDGEGVAIDYAQALSWFNQSAQRGFSEASYDLAQMYQKGQGCEVDLASANRWYAKAVDKQFPAAQFALGKNTFYGYGVDKDEQAGIALIRLSAEAGYQPGIDFVASSLVLQ